MRVTDNRTQERDWRTAAPDVVLVGAAIAVLLATSVWTSHRKAMWFDEIVTFRLVTDPSLRHMLGAITAGADSAPPLYHLLARAWVAVAGPRPIALRLFSSVGLSTALVVLWFTLRQAYARLATALGVLTVFGLGSLVLTQNAEVRFYGVFACTSAIAVSLCFALMTRERVGRGLWVGNVISQAALVLTHIYGSLYGGALCFTLVVWDLARGQWRPARYASFVAGWLAFLTYVPALVRQRHTAQRSWIPVPIGHDLIDAFGLGIGHLAVVVIAAVLLPRLVGRTPAAFERADDEARRALRRDALLWLGVGLLGVPIAAFVISRVSVSIFWPRYLLPTSFAWAVFLAELVTMGEQQAGVHGPERRAWRARVGAAGWAVVIAALVVSPIDAERQRTPTLSPWVPIERMVARDPRAHGLPLIVEDARQYAELAFDSSAARAAAGNPPVRYPLDSAVAYDRRTPADMVGPEALFNEMRLFQRLGYDQTGPVEARAVLCGNDPFVVVRHAGDAWYKRRIASDSAFERVALAGVDRDDGVVLVTRLPGRTPAACATGVDASAPNAR